jgi:hypothetical protein
MPSVKPPLLRKQGDDFLVPGEALLDLMQAVLARGASFHFRARGLSMAPFIKSGDLITVVPLAQEKPSVGKVVAFVHPVTRKLVIHRIIDRQGVAFLIQGDNTAGQADGWVEPQAILGCVTRVQRDGRRVYLGLGPERYLVAFLSKNGWLDSVVRRLRAFK